MIYSYLKLVLRKQFVSWLLRLFFKIGYILVVVDFIIELRIDDYLQLF